MRIVLEARKRVLPRLGYGGMPRMVWSLASALTKMGHDVHLLCAPGSVSNFAHIIEYDPARRLEEQLPEGTDIVHFNFEPPADFALPYVETIHGNYNRRLSLNSIFVSADHARRHGSQSYVLNGLDWDDGEYRGADLTHRREDYHFLAKADWNVKNVHGAISVIRRMPPGPLLHVLGGRRVSLHMGFRLSLDQRVSFHGYCAGDMKKRLIERSLGLVLPVIWHEPFGLSVIESLWWGSPVYATPYGAMPEIVTPDVGVLADNAAELALAMREADFVPQRCHEYAADVFNARRMAEGYLRKYERVLNGERLNDAPPCQRADEPPTTWRD